MGMSVSSGGGVKAEPNVVPMIDVMLVLLIIFMVVTPAITSGFQATPPEGVNLKEHPEEETDMVLGIDKYGQYFLQKQQIPNEQLGELLTNIYANRDDAILYVKADRGLQYEVVLEAMDIAAKSGVRVVGAISDQLPGTMSTVPGDIMAQKQQ
jgi:biopolymer transport protein TolR